MRTFISINLLALVMVALAACGERSTPAEKPAASPSAIEPQLKALEKAKGVEQTLADQAEAQRKAIEDAEKR
jgi:predicted small lipoprotein YifL